MITPLRPKTTMETGTVEHGPGGKLTYMWTVDCPVCGLGKRHVTFDFVGFVPKPETVRLWATCRCAMGDDARVMYVTLAARAFDVEYGGR